MYTVTPASWATYRARRRFQRTRYKMAWVRTIILTVLVVAAFSASAQPTFSPEVQARFADPVKGPGYREQVAGVYHQFYLGCGVDIEVTTYGREGRGMRLRHASSDPIHWYGIIAMLSMVGDPYLLGFREVRIVNTKEASGMGERFWRFTGPSKMEGGAGGFGSGLKELVK